MLNDKASISKETKDKIFAAMQQLDYHPNSVARSLPLAAPAVASVSIFYFLTVWEEYPWANTVINDTNLRTLPIAIAGFFGQHQFTQWGYVFAMSVLTLIPVILVFVTCQKLFVRGLAAGSVKG